MTRCPWCGGPNDGILLLCMNCEAVAVVRRKRVGLPIRQVPPVVVAHSEPDD